MNLARSACLNIVPIVCGDVVVVEGQRHLVAMLVLVGHPLQRLTADEVVVELDEVSVAEVPWGEVVVLDVVGVEAAADRGRALVAGGGQPLAVALERSPV